MNGDALTKRFAMLWLKSKIRDDMPIAVPGNVFAALAMLADLPWRDQLHRPTAITGMLAAGQTEAAIWIEENPVAYTHGLMYGFFSPAAGVYEESQESEDGLYLPGINTDGTGRSILRGRRTRTGKDHRFEVLHSPGADADSGWQVVLLGDIGRSRESAS